MSENKCVFVTDIKSGVVCGEPAKHSFESRTDLFNEDWQIRNQTETVHFCQKHWDEHLRLRAKGEHAWVSV